MAQAFGGGVIFRQISGDGLACTFLIRSKYINPSSGFCRRLYVLLLLCGENGGVTATIGRLGSWKRSNMTHRL
jgi:hypothetical protein